MSAAAGARGRRMLVTGGAGFIGVHAALEFARTGWHLTLLDDLSRQGARENLEWLRARAAVGFERVDVREGAEVDRVVAASRPEVVLHLAAQVAVTSSIADPRADFEVNALGTFNVLDAVRRLSPASLVINASTNKVYGRMDDLAVVERDGRYRLRDLARGVGEDRGVDFHSPYGCSKGAADQYAIDFARVYGLRTVTFRQSCIYGTRQFGVEDQGWVAWFAIAAVTGRRITIYGDGKQVRDVLHVRDLVAAYRAVVERPETARGRAFNIGGGPTHTLSPLELVALLERLLGHEIPLAFDARRAGDQPVFVCCVDRAGRELGWAPAIAAQEGVRELVEWVSAHRELFGERAEHAP